MNPSLLRLFQTQVLLQCEYVLLAATELNASLVAIKSTRSGESTKRTFYAIQNLLNASANISKALWGSGGRPRMDRALLRNSLGISDASPLKDTLMRNNFEHFDERLESWEAESIRHNYFDLSVGPPEMVQGFDNTDMFRWFDPRTTDVIFWGQRFNLQTLVNEVSRILPILQAETSKPPWTP